MARRYTDPSDTTDLARLDPEAIDAVREQAWPQVRNADEMHEALMTLACVSEAEAEASGWTVLLKTLAKHQRATLLNPAPIMPAPESNPSPPGRGAGVRVRAERGGTAMPDPHPRPLSRRERGAIDYSSPLALSVATSSGTSLTITPRERFGGGA